MSSCVRIHWGKIVYGSYYYVSEAHRGAGYGTRLRDVVARGHVADKILVVDSVQGSVAKKNIDKFGYKYSGFNTARFKGVAKQSVDGVLKYTGGEVVQVGATKVKHSISDQL